MSQQEVLFQPFRFTAVQLQYGCIACLRSMSLATISMLCQNAAHWMPFLRAPRLAP